MDEARGQRKAQHLARLIAGSVAEVDPRQIAIYTRFAPLQRLRQMGQLSDWLRQENRRRIARETGIKEGDYRSMNTPTDPRTEMSLIEFARLVIDALESTGLDYMLGGALAVAAWAEARSTQDVDLAVNVPLERMAQLSQELEKRDMLVPAEIILDLWRERRADLPVNAIHLYTGYKAELFLVRPGEEFRQSAMSRRQRVDLGPPLGEVYVISPEDLILFKLHYFHLSEQPKHTRDIASILLAQGEQLDYAYLDSWAARQGLTELWEKVRSLTVDLAS